MLKHYLAANQKVCLTAIYIFQLNYSLALTYSNQVTTLRAENTVHLLRYFLCFAHFLPCCKLCNHISCVLLVGWHQQVEAHWDAECALQRTRAAAGLIRAPSWLTEPGYDGGGTNKLAGQVSGGRGIVENKQPGVMGVKELNWNGWGRGSTLL